MKLINRSRKAIILGKDLPPNIKLEKVLIELKLIHKKKQ